MYKMVLVALMALTLFSIAIAGEQKVEITAPSVGSLVSQRPIIEGQVSDPMATVWVVVHPLDVSDYWVQPRVTVRNNGVWKVQIYIGRPGQADEGKIFEIRAVANPVGEMREGKILPGWPKAEAISNVIEVRRK